MSNYKGGLIYKLPDGQGGTQYIDEMSPSHIVNHMALSQNRLVNLYRLAQWNDSEHIDKMIKGLEKQIRGCNEHLNREH